MLRSFLCLFGAFSLAAGTDSAFSQGPIWRTLPNAPIANYPGRQDDVFFINPSVGWVLNNNITWGPFNSEIWKTTDGGVTWTLQFSGDQYLRSVGFANSLTGWVGTVYPDTIQVLYQTTNGGITWSVVQNISEPRPRGICGISVVNDSLIYASGRYNGPARVIKTTDRGTSWISMDLSAHAGALVDCYFFSPDSGFVVGSSGPAGYARVLFTSDGGNTWTVRYEGDRKGEICWKIQFRTKKIGYVSIQNFSEGPTYYLKSTDGGITWNDQLFRDSALVGSNGVQGIGFVSDSLGWLGGWIDDVYETTDAGTSWHSAGFSEGNAAIINRFRILGDTLAYAVGNRVHKYSIDGSATWVQEDHQAEIPRYFSLSQNYPNPFNPTTRINFVSPLTSHVSLKIYNILGQEVATLVNDEMKTGSYEVTWDASGFPSGVYFYWLTAGAFAETRKLMLMR